MTIQAICDGIEALIQKARIPFSYIPAALIVCSAVKRPGLSAMLIASNIIKRQTEAGAPYGPAADGTENVAEAMERIRVEEMVKALKMDSNIQGATPIGGIRVLVNGANAGGAFTAIGCNTNNAKNMSLLN